MPGSRRRSVVAALSAVTACAVLVAVSACSGRAADVRALAANGLGDPCYPSDGSPGYDVLGFAVHPTYDPATSTMTSMTHVAATATSHRATYTRVDPHELVLHPSSPLPPGRPLDVVVSHHGQVGEAGMGAVDRATLAAEPVPRHARRQTRRAERRDG